MAEYIRLTTHGSKALHLPVGGFAFESEYEGGGSIIYFSGDEFLVRETEAEILALLGLRDDPK